MSLIKLAIHPLKKINKSFLDFADEAWNSSKEKSLKRSTFLSDEKDDTSALRVRGITIEWSETRSESSDGWDKPSRILSLSSCSSFGEQLFSEPAPHFEPCTPEDSWILDDDILLRGKKDEKPSIHKIDSEKKAMTIETQNLLLSKDENHWIQVVRKGTKFMKSLNYPTVLIKLLTGNLEKSTVHYLILEFETGELTGEVPAVIFSCPYAHRKTKYAELLPLLGEKSKSSGTFEPMLRSKIYKRAFRIGNSFKVKALIPKRAFNGSAEYPWNRYDLRNKESHNRVLRFLDLDINQMSCSIINTLKPPQITDRSKISQNCKSPSKSIVHSSEMSQAVDEILLKSDDCKLSLSESSLRLPEITSKREKFTHLHAYMNKDLQFD